MFSICLRICAIRPVTASDVPAPSTSVGLVLGDHDLLGGTQVSVQVFGDAF